MPTKEYWQIIKNDETRYTKEKERVCNILNDKYHNDENYRQQRKEKALAYYYKKKNERNRTVETNDND